MNIRTIVLLAVSVIPIVAVSWMALFRRDR